MSRPSEHLSSVTEMTILKHHSQSQVGSMAYQPTRSKFMIHDILGSGSEKFNPNSSDRTPSPKDLSLFLNSIPEHDDESDCDSSKLIFNRRKREVFKFFFIQTFNEIPELRKSLDDSKYLIFLCKKFDNATDGEF